MSLISSLIPSLGAAPAIQPPAKDATPATDLGPTVTPRYQLNETAEAYGLTVELPGVAKDGLELTIDHEQIHVVGRRAARQPEAWTALHRETRDARFELALEHGRAVDPETIRAELRDGQLRVALPKAGALKPRKIAVA
jgi:HSP20 family molecular chaperone IbpA